jgi:hypothetical protein
MTMGLQYTVNNSSGPETNASIQNKAPQAYYTQNRMVTAEDYNIAPLTVGNDILKVKSVNRVSSGLSKYFDLSDISGKYSKTNIFANDGILYKKAYEQNFEFSSTNRNEIFSVIKQQLAPVIASAAMRSFYFDLYPRPTLDYATPDTFYWKQVNKTSGQSRGYFYQGTGGVEIQMHELIAGLSNQRKAARWADIGGAPANPAGGAAAPAANPAGGAAAPAAAPAGGAAAPAAAPPAIEKARKARGKGKKRKKGKKVEEEQKEDVNPFSTAPMMISMVPLVARKDENPASPTVGQKIGVGCLMRVLEEKVIDSTKRMFIALDGDTEALGWVTGLTII